MTKTISVKELRMNFPKIKKELDAGEDFVIIYRSKPLAKLSPLETYKKPFGDRIEGKKFDFPDTLEDFVKNIDKYAFKLPGGKKIDAVKLIREERGYED